MTITGYHKVEDCFDGSSVLEYVFDTPWSREDVLRLRQIGEVDYYPHFPRPFFRLRGHDGGQVKGVQGETTCRVILPGQCKEDAKREFEALFCPDQAGER